MRDDAVGELRADAFKKRPAQVVFKALRVLGGGGLGGGDFDAAAEAGVVGCTAFDSNRLAEVEGGERWGRGVRKRGGGGGARGPVTVCLLPETLQVRTATTKLLSAFRKMILDTTPVRPRLMAPN